MKICYIADSESIHTKRWVEHFANKGHDVHLIDYNNIQFKNVKTHVLSIPDLKGLKTLIRTYKVRNIIKRINPDIVHVHGIGSLSYSFAFIDFHPLIVSPWGSDVLISMKKSRTHRFLATRLLKKADIVLGESEKIKREILKYSVPQKILMIPWGLDTKDFTPNIKSREIKHSLSINDSLTVISTRPFAPVYNIETLIKAIPIVTKEFPDAKFILKNFGQGIPFKDKMEILAKNLNVSNQIRFVGETEYNELPKYLNASDIYVSTSLSDSCSVSMLEAMACVLPVVVSDELSNFEWIKDGWNGYIFPRKDHRALAEKLIMLLKDKEKRKLFGKRNRKIIEERGDWNKNMEKVEHLYENLINKYKK